MKICSNACSVSENTNTPYSIIKSLLIILIGVLLGLEVVCAQSTIWVSKDADGNEGNGTNYYPSISGDGCFVAFQSDADNLVPDDTNGWEDIFVHDCLTGDITRVNVDSDGNQANSQTLMPSISADGRYVAFWSSADNLVAGDINGWEAFVYDRLSGETSRVCVSTAGVACNDGSGAPSISADGRYVAFGSMSDNLVPNDTNMNVDTFVHDRKTGETTRVSVNSDGDQVKGGGFRTSISADGRYVVFQSLADDLVLNDTNQVDDIFVHDRKKGETSRVSINSNGNEGNGISEVYFTTSISADGRYIAFSSEADNLVPYDENEVNDVFVHDREMGETTLVSVDSFGNQANGYSGYRAPISADGRYISFWTEADNLIHNDTNEGSDVFVHDRVNAETIRVSVDSDGNESDGSSWNPAISADGRYVAFQSFATNLVLDVTNDNYGYEIYVHGPLIPELSLQVNIDIAPKRDPNRINPEYGRLLVAILTDAEFEAIEADPQTIRFGPDEANPTQYKVADIDRDGDMDLVLYFQAQETGISCGDTEATLTGETFQDISFSGVDTIVTIGCH